jgi:Protein of unknown function (DUF1073)
LPSSNGLYWGQDPISINQSEEFLRQLMDQRRDFLRRFGQPLNDVDTACSYPDALQASFFRTMFDRMAIAERVVRLYPAESWKVLPEVYDGDSPSDDTKFRRKLKSLSRSLMTQSWHRDDSLAHLWSYLARADVLSGIGVFGGMLIGIDDGRLLQDPADGVPPDGQPMDVTGVGELTTKDIYGGQLPKQMVRPYATTMGTDAQYFGVQFSPMQLPGSGKGDKRQLTFLRVFDETLVQVVQYEASMYSPRFGQPIMYLITLNDPRQPHTGVGLPLATVRVHWSRFVHYADSLINSEIFGVPRQRPVVNNIWDLRKLYGGSAEGFWQMAFPGISFETNPALGGDVDVDVDSLRDMYSDWRSGTERAFFLVGMQAKSLSPQASDPTPHIDKQIEAICIHLGCPVRVFKGSERGELASSQDDEAWNDRVKQRQQVYLTPRVIAPFIDRLIMLGILPQPKEGYTVKWPDIESLGTKDRAAVGLQRTQTMAAYVQSGVDQLMPEDRFLRDVMEMPAEEVEDVLEEAAKKAEDDGEEADSPLKQYSDQAVEDSNA